MRWQINLTEIKLENCELLLKLSGTPRDTMCCHGFPCPPPAATVWG